MPIVVHTSKWNSDGSSQKMFESSINRELFTGKLNNFEIFFSGRVKIFQLNSKMKLDLSLLWSSSFLKWKTPLYFCNILMHFCIFVHFFLAMPWQGHKKAFRWMMNRLLYQVHIYLGRILQLIDIFLKKVKNKLRPTS